MGTQHLRIPYGFIKALCYGGGNRLAPRINRTPPPEGTTEAVPITQTWTGSGTGSYSPSGSTVISPTNVTQIAGGRDICLGLGNLSNEMYRYFMGISTEESTFFTCRGCLIPESGREKAPRHFDNCRQLIQFIAERVRRDKVCVICNTGTQRECWKIPLCSDLCITKWRFSIPPAWTVARRFVLAAEPKLLKLRIHPDRTEGTRETLH